MKAVFALHHGALAGMSDGGYGSSHYYDIMLASQRHTGEQVNEWMLQTYGNNHISVCFCVLILLFQIHSQFLFLSIFVSVLLVNAVLQSLDLSAITHDHGPDISKAVSLSLIHSILCFDHELDNSVNPLTFIISTFQRRDIKKKNKKL